MNPVKQPTRLFIRMRKVILREDFMALTKDINQALVLSQMLYWTKKIDDLNDMILEENKRLAENNQPQMEYFHGWIWKSARQMKEELFHALSEDAIQRAFAALADRGLFVRRRNPNFKYDRTLQYRIDLVLLRRSLKDIGIEFTDFQLGSIPHSAESMPHGAESIPHIADSTPPSAETIPEITIENTLENTSESNPLPPFTKGEVESSAMASHSTGESGFLFPPDQPTVDSNASEASASKIDPPKTEKIGFAKSENSPPQKTRRQAKPVDDAFIAQITELNPHFKPEVEMPKIKTWLLKHPNRKLTRGLVVNWSNNILQRKQETVEKDETPRLPNGEIDWAKVKPRD